MARQNTGGRGRAIAFMGIALFMASGAAYGLYALVQDYETQLAEARQREQNVPVVIAARNLAQGGTLGEEDLTVFEVPPHFVPATTFSRPEDVYGRVPKERVLKHEYLREERLAQAEEGTGLNAIIPRGMRALPVNITNGSAVSGFVMPGNYVDVLVSVNNGVVTNEKQTLTLLQAVQVLAVDNMVGQGEALNTGKQAPSVTLALTPEDALKMTHSVREAAVTLTLRNDIDVTEVETNGASPKDLIGKDSMRKKVRRGSGTSSSTATTTTTLKIIRGQRVEEKDPTAYGSRGRRRR
ncbi:MAG: Flp pilus assembly protein CpaB [Proteobacteria bacterium]|nr:Flp pilus assembly protein CpaB [Pseudomonadota bacterium]